jgi:hypothetical protein
VLGTQETFFIVIAGLFERDSFDLFLPEFDKPWVIHLRETCCCSTNLCTLRPNTVYKDRSVRRHQAAPVTTQDCIAAINFIKSIVFRFGVPHSIIIDNGTNFTFKEFKNYCKSMGIKLKFASVAHPKTNGQVKKANGLICDGIKKRLLAPLEKAKHAWVDELPSVLWSLRTTPNASTQETPFFLVHGAEAMLLVEITHEAPKIAAYDKTTSTEALQDGIDALDEARDVALARAT